MNTIFPLNIIAECFNNYFIDKTYQLWRIDGDCNYVTVDPDVYGVYHQINGTAITKTFLYNVLNRSLEWNEYLQKIKEAEETTHSYWVIAVISEDGDDLTIWSSPTVLYKTEEEAKNAAMGLSERTSNAVACLKMVGVAKIIKEIRWTPYASSN